jgi:hypothetical protein
MEQLQETVERKPEEQQVLRDPPPPTLVPGPGPHGGNEDGMRTPSLFDTADGTSPAFTVVQDTSEDLEVALLANSSQQDHKLMSCKVCACIPAKYRTKITAAITLVLSSIATALITQYVQKGADCAKFDVSILPSNVGHT